jgi:hypothetical protein
MANLPGEWMGIDTPIQYDMTNDEKINQIQVCTNDLVELPEPSKEKIRKLVRQLKDAEIPTGDKSMTALVMTLTEDQPLETLNHAVQIVALIVILCVWLLPIYIADKRHHPNSLPITLLTLLLGWTFLGWVIALIWSCLALPNRPVALPPTPKTIDPILSQYDRVIRNGKVEYITREKR